jgi:hypothetical protein
MTSTDLAVPSVARAALARAQTLPEIKQVIDGSAVGLEAIKRLRMPVEELIEWADVKLDAERAAGKYLLSLLPQRGVRTTEGRSTPLQTALSEAGFNQRKDSSTPGIAERWQLIARLPEDRYEKIKAAAREQGKPVTQGTAVKAAQEWLRSQQAPPSQPAASAAPPEAVSAPVFRQPAARPSRERSSMLNMVAAVRVNAAQLEQAGSFPADMPAEERAAVLKDMKQARTMISRFITAREMNE